MAINLECGKISNEIFQIVCVNAINKAFHFERNDKMADTYKNNNILVDLVKPNQFLLTIIVPNDYVLSLSIKYIFDSIIKIDGNWQAYKGSTLNTSEGRELINERLKLELEKLQITISANLTDFSTITEMLTYYNYALNPVSCFNAETGQVEHIRLTPHCDLLKVNRQIDYNNLHIGWKRELHPDEKNRMVIADARDNNGLGKLYVLSNDKLESLQNAENHAWWPICSIIKNSDIRINTPLLVTSCEDDSITFWVFLSTTGIIYDDKIIKSPLVLEDGEIDEKLSACLCYNYDNKSIKLSFTEEDPNFYIDTEEYENKKFKVIKTESIEAHNEDSKLMALISNVPELGECEYYDGTEFKELISRDSRQMQKAQAEQEKWANEHPISYLLLTFRKQIFIAIIVIVFIIIGMCS